MNVKRTLVYGAVAASLALSAAFIQPQPANAQGGPFPITRFGLGNPCSTTDYTEIAATALGITAPELRVALVSGKTLQDLATANNVSVGDVNKALEDARQADLAQAQADGTVPEAPELTTLPGKIEIPGGSDKIFPRGGVVIKAVGAVGIGGYVSPNNEINPMTVAADAIGVSCPDLVKAVLGGKSIVQVATEKSVQVQTVIDAIVNARKAALAQDIAEGLITQAQADGRSVNLVQEVTMMISQPGGMMMWSFGGFGNGFSYGFRVERNDERPGRSDRGDKDAPKAPEATPEATPNA
jgi:hypothetical protein